MAGLRRRLHHAPSATSIISISDCWETSVRRARGGSVVRAALAHEARREDHLRVVMDHAAHEVDVRLRVRRLAAFAASSSESSREGSGAPACRTRSAPSSAASSESAQPPSRAAAARATTTQRVPNWELPYPSEGSGSHTGLARVHCWEWRSSHEEVSPGAARRGSGHAQTGRFLCGVLLLMGVLTASASAQLPDPNDPRVASAPGSKTPGWPTRGWISWRM